MPNFIFSIDFQFQQHHDKYMCPNVFDIRIWVFLTFMWFMQASYEGGFDWVCLVTRKSTDRQQYLWYLFNLHIFETGLFNLPFWFSEFKKNSGTVEYLDTCIFGTTFFTVDYVAVQRYP